MYSNPYTPYEDTIDGQKDIGMIINGHYITPLKNEYIVISLKDEVYTYLIKTAWVASFGELYTFPIGEHGGAEDHEHIQTLSDKDVLYIRMTGKLPHA